MEARQIKPRLSRPWQIVIILLVNLTIFVTLLYGLELYLTLTDPRLKLPPKPVEVRNKYGFRERDFGAKPPGACRIMVLGDSFTWGKGVWAEERYTTLLETYLNHEYPYKKFEVLNFGFTGAATIKERDSLRDYKDLVEPDLVVVGFVINDPQTRRQNYSVERDQFNEKYGVLLDSMLEEVEDRNLEHTADMLRDVIENFIVKVGIVPTWQVALQRAYEKDSAKWQMFEQALRDIKSMSDRMKLPQPIFTVLNQGTYTDRPTDYNNPDEELKPLLRWYHQAEETAAHLGFDPINHERELAEQLTNEPVAVNVLDGHPSARVHRIYAQKLFKEIKKYVDAGKMCETDFVRN